MYAKVFNGKGDCQVSSSRTTDTGKNTFSVSTSSLRNASYTYHESELSDREYKGYARGYIYSKSSSWITYTITF